MGPIACAQPYVTDSVLSIASKPSSKVDELLQYILEMTLSVTASDAGGCLCLFDCSNGGSSLTEFVINGNPAHPLTHAFRGRNGPLCDIGCLSAQSRMPHLIDDHRRDTAHPAMLSGGRSSLSVPLVDEDRLLGIVHVESSEPRHYRRDDLGRIHGLMTEAVTAIDRHRFKEHLNKSGSPMGIVGISAAFLNLERHIKRVASCYKGPVLIMGERGSGKELAARAVHYWSIRRERAFVPVLTSAFAESLFADELFGHERHAFTDAAKERLGKFKVADGGTIFFDEVSDMSPTVQSALLRIIERGELPRIGRDMPMRVDVRVIAATNLDPLDLIAEGRFRQDLYDRLSVFEIRVPPLRERREEIPLLASHFLSKYCADMRRAHSADPKGGCQVCQTENSGACATPEFYRALEAYAWPGNIRELENVIIRLLASVPDEVLDVRHLREHLPKIVRTVASPQQDDWTLDRAVKDHIERVLQRSNFNRSKAARALGIPLSTLRSKMKKLGIELISV